ncbi:3'-5' ssDNA/RNA exonuclease TatD-like [Saccostrea cucullata]|uniref:3'-5' ssDNA/RNA exonuclease TatD-like n=1 Tax=Saccostrea cuccullata TaxID=36930 RepID=UPI002ED0FFA8
MSLYRSLGECAVYVDGPTPPTDTSPEPGWVTAVGFHPTQVAGVTASSIRSLVDRCVGNGWVIGEVGLDYFRGSNWGHQRWVLGEFCRLATPLTPLLLHLRGAPSDPMGQEPLLDCQHLLDQVRTPLWVPLYLHSFTGGVSQVDEWLATGRVVFFGVSGLIQHFTWGQLPGVRQIPTDRLLIETDSPHLGVDQGEMTPGQIGVIYRRVAEVRQVEVGVLAEQVVRNFSILFGQQLRHSPLP